MNFIKYAQNQNIGKPNNFKLFGSVKSKGPKQDISKSTKDVLSVQGVWHSSQTLPTVVHGACFRNHNLTTIIESPHPYLPSGDAATMFDTGNLHHYPATTHKRHAYTINIIIGIISL